MTYILILIGAYFALLVLLSLTAAPYRRRLRQTGEALLEGKLQDQERRFVEGVLSSGYSWRSAVMLFLVYTTALFKRGSALDREREKFEKDSPVLAKDPRVHILIDTYFASVAAVNPLFGAPAYAVRWAFRLKARRHHNLKDAQKITDFLGMSVPA